MAHPDFRLGGKIFATLGYPDQASAVVMLSPTEQLKLVRTHPSAFTPVKRAWGRRGSTHVRLDAVNTAVPAKCYHHGVAEKSAPASDQPRN